VKLPEPENEEWKMSRAHESAAEILDGLLRRGSDQEPPTLAEIDEALESIEELSKEASSEEDETYLESAGETILGLRESALARER
jgi:hypothetical protein